MSLERVFRIAKADGTQLLDLEQYFTLKQVSRTRELYAAPAILEEGLDLQVILNKPFDFSLTAQIASDDPGLLRSVVEDVDTALGLVNRRFYRYESRFLWVRHLSTTLRFPHMGVRRQYMELEISLKAMDPKMYDDDFNSYRWF